MCTIGQMRRTPQRQMPVVMIEDADPAAFGGDIDTVSARIVGQYVWRFADSVVVNHVSVGQVDCDHCGVGLTADEHHLVGDVESLAVRVVAAGCGNAFRHSKTEGSMTARSLRPCTATTIWSRNVSYTTFPTSPPN